MARAPSERSVDSRVLNYILDSRQAVLDAETEEGEALSPQPSEQGGRTRYSRYEYLRGPRRMESTNVPRGEEQAPPASVETETQPPTGPTGRNDTDGPRRSQRLRVRSRSRSRSRSPLRRRRSPAKERLGSSPAPTGKGRLSCHLPKDSKRLIAKDISMELSGLMTKGVPSDDSKAIQEEFGVEFDQSSFSINPPRLDDWMARQLKEKAARKTVEASEKVWLSAQFKVMDIAPPLLHLLSDFGEDDPHNPVQRAVVAALMQWARAFNFISRRRRQNVLNCTAPRLEYLLDSPESFSSQETIKDLFGKSFLAEMEEQRKLDRTFQQLEETTTQGPSSSSAQRGRGGGNNSRGRGRGRGGNKDRGYAPNNDSNYTPIAQRYEIIHSPLSICDSHVGARTKFFASNWKSITSDTWVLNAVSDGVKIDFVDLPFQSSLPSSIAMTTEMQSVCDLEVANLLSKKAIIEIDDDSSGFISSLFVIAKKSGGYRPIVNLKPLNSFVRYEHFKMEGLETVKSLVRKGDWLVKLDLKDAYLTIPIFPAHQKYLRFKWGGRIFQFTCLPFGLCSAPRTFTKILKSVVTFFRLRGLRMVIYLDDILILNQDKDGILADLRLVVETLQALGFLVSWDKSVTDPSQCLDYLGIVLNSINLTLSLPTKKLEEIKSLCIKALSQSQLSLRDLARILGQFAWATPSIPFAQAHFRSLQSFFIKKAKSFNQDLSVKCILDQKAREDLNWWLSSLDSVNGKPISPRTPDIIIYSDASLKGWGAYSSGRKARGPWTSEQKHLHINELELLAAFNALRSFSPHSTNAAIRIFLDNNTAVCYINKCGGTRSRNLTDTAKLIANWCELRNNFVEAVYLPGKLNVLADEQSRVGTDASD